MARQSSIGNQYTLPDLEFSTIHVAFQLRQYIDHKNTFGNRQTLQSDALRATIAIVTDLYPLNERYGDESLYAKEADASYLTDWVHDISRLNRAVKNFIDETKAV